MSLLFLLRVLPVPTMVLVSLLGEVGGTSSRRIVRSPQKKATVLFSRVNLLSPITSTLGLNYVSRQGQNTPKTA